MSDFFLLSTQEGLFGRIQSISLGYNLAGLMPMVFEMVETMNWMSEKLRCQVKRLLFNYETALIGEFITAAVLQHYLTTLSRSQLKDTQPAAEVVSYYLMGLAGHIVLALGCLTIIVSTRAIVSVLGGYIWEDGELYYRPGVLKALGVLKVVEPDGTELFVHMTLHWISIPCDNLTVLWTVDGHPMESPGDKLRSDHLMLDDDGEDATAAIWGTVLGKNAAYTTHEQDQDINSPLEDAAFLSRQPFEKGGVSLLCGTTFPFNMLQLVDAEPELFEKKFEIDASRVGLKCTRCSQCDCSCSTDAEILLNGEKMKSYMIEYVNGHKTDQRNPYRNRLLEQHCYSPAMFNYGHDAVGLRPLQAHDEGRALPRSVSTDTYANYGNRLVTLLYIPNGDGEGRQRSENNACW
ncbi:hypothetical protein PHYSODRAFT_323980 [Phytophthora sojae]|uniref:Uncharacterized protein n=1 Tax=Phytophthora sojae (strain P6497) TaxID=1094619 RepID=G4YR05_PHYSP|nr:hypothetical protein PHYSODRAFT_323980 [Phytophthora sojae]EGZ30633.1 hypothetical protein PHYSODRAFT_323980 [Phytophthora sojae]|eukprot:XP_009517908.1 hypothetical protein PHYSODRAFT_323980 [Phytophthora sojae]